MDKKAEVTYNPQLGYLKTVFTHNFDFLTEIREYRQEESALELTVGTYRKKTAKVRVDFLTGEAFRFRMYPFEDTAVYENAVFPLEGKTGYELQVTEDCLTASTGRMTLRFGKRPWELSVFLDGKLLTRENVCDANVDNMCKYLPIGFDCDEQGRVIRVRETMYLPSDESFYGFGEKFTGFDKRGQVIHCRQCDALSTNTEKSYKNIPYFMSSRGYSILLNTYTDNVFDMCEGSGVSYGMESADRMLDYMLFCNRDYKGLLSDYTALTGRSPMIPKWAFGLWMSRCSYQTQEEVEAVARRLREEQIPADVIHIDGWQKMSEAGVWQWDLERFPDPRGMIKTLSEQHFHLSLWMWPYIAVGTEGYEYARAHGYLVMNDKGEVSTFHSAATSDAWFAAFDFTNPEMVAWYRGLVQAVVKEGVGVIKTDFSEAVPLDAVYHDGSNGLQGHNKLPLLYAKTIYEACRDVKQEQGERPMLWGRSGYAGTQNYPGNWAGDSSTAENNLACILRGGLSMGLSAVPFWGHDIGGFYNTDSDGYECPPTEEQYIRSAQFGLLSPLSRCHGKTPREPWYFSQQAQEIFRAYDRLRYRLIPYLYSIAWEAHSTGVPMLRALLLEYPDDCTARCVGMEYMLGSSLLVAPVFDQDDFRVYLPEGNWASLLTGGFTEGGRWVRPGKQLENIPVYLRENSALPIQGKDLLFTEEKPFEDLCVLMNLSTAAEEIFFDDGQEYRFRAELKGGTVTVETGLPMTSAVLYTQQPVVRAVVNGEEYTVEERSATVKLLNKNCAVPAE